MKFIKTGLLTMLVSLFIFGGCKNPSGIGLDVDANIAIKSIVIDTSTVLTKLMKQDSVVANFTNASALGYFKDPVFGITTSNIAVALTLPSANFSFGKSPVLDSAVLVLPFAGFYGDSTNTNYTVEVRQLNEVLYNDVAKTYFNNKKWALKSAVIGSKNFAAKYRDSIILQDIIVGKKDTIKKVPAQLRIKLDPTFITNNILKTDSLNLINNTAFNSLIKGLYISLNKSTTTNNGGVFIFDTNTQNAAKLNLYYKRTSSTNTIDTLNTSLAIAGANGYAVSEVSWDFTGTAVQTELQNTGKNSTNLYFKGLSGTQVKVDFPYLEKLKSLGTNIAINRAELILQIVNGTESPYKPIPRLRVYRFDIASRPQLIPDENQNDPRYLGPGFVDGFYNKTSKSYVFNFTGYIQDLIIGKTKNYGTFITPLDITTANTISPILTGYKDAFSQPGRTVTGGSNVTYKTKLKIYYTDLK